MWRTILRVAGMAAAMSVATGCGARLRVVSATDPSSPLRLERMLTLPEVAGRIDHLALDTAHGRLFIAEYGNGTVDEIDLASGHVLGRIGGLDIVDGCRTS